MNILTSSLLTIILGILSTSELNSGLGINMDGQDPDSSYVEQSNCDAELSNGETICGTKKMACRETSNNGEIECSSFCSGKLSKCEFSPLKCKIPPPVSGLINITALYI